MSEQDYPVRPRPAAPGGGQRPAVRINTNPSTARRPPGGGGRPPGGRPGGGGRPPGRGVPSGSRPQGGRHRRHRPWTPPQAWAILATLVVLVGVVAWAGLRGPAPLHPTPPGHPLTTRAHTATTTRARTTTTKATPRTTLPPPTTTTTTIAPSLSGSPVVQTWQHTFVDPNGASLPTEVLYPATSGGLPIPGHHPLIVFAEGYLAVPSYYSGLLQYWAQAGFVVAAPIFPGTSAEAAHPEENNTDAQPGEVGFLISSLLTLNHSPNNPLQGLIYPTAVGVAGHSDGGDAVSAVSYNPCCYYNRVAATVILSGAEGFWLPAGSYFTAPDPSPLLVVQGTADQVNLPSASQQLYGADPGPKYYLSIDNATHWTPYSENPTPLSLPGNNGIPLPQLSAMAQVELPVVEQVTTAFFTAALVPGSGVTPAQITADGTVSGVSSIVSSGVG